MDDFFTLEEKKELFSLYRHLLQSAGDSIFGHQLIKLDIMITTQDKELLAR